VLLQDEASPVLRFTGGPRGAEGPLTGVVDPDPAARDAREFSDLPLAGKAKL
jgi:hypothetical protein